MTTDEARRVFLKQLACLRSAIAVSSLQEAGRALHALRCLYCDPASRHFFTRDIEAELRSLVARHPQLSEKTLAKAGLVVPPDARAQLGNRALRPTPQFTPTHDPKRCEAPNCPICARVDDDWDSSSRTQDADVKDVHEIDDQDQANLNDSLNDWDDHDLELGDEYG